MGLLALAPLYVAYLLSVARIGAALASILLYTAPLWVIALSTPLLGEAPGRGGMVAFILGFTGVILVSGPGWSLDPLGIILGLVSGLSYGLYILLARLAQLRGASSLEVGLHAIPFAAIGVVAVVRPPIPPSLVEAAWSLYLGLVATLLPYILHTRALARLEAYRVSLVSLVEPLSAVLLAVIILGEDLAPLQALGGALILASSYLAARR